MSTSGGTDTRIIDINASGNYVFSRTDVGGSEEYYSNIEGTETLLSYQPQAINNQNVIAGITTSGERYIIDEGSGNIQFLTPSSSITSNINLSSDAGGDYTIIAGVDIWKRQLDGNGELDSGFSRFDLNDFMPSASGWSDVTAGHISANGLVVGSGKLNGIQHGILLLKGD